MLRVDETVIGRKSGAVVRNAYRRKMAVLSLVHRDAALSARLWSRRPPPSICC